MSDSTPTTLLLRVKKLLALANDGGATEAEAQLAATKVQEILQDHGLTLAQVEATSDAPEEVREKKTTDRRAMYEYQQQLMAVLADNNFCLHHVARHVFVASKRKGDNKRKIIDGVTFTGHYEKRHLLVGRRLNVDVTIQTYDYLSEALRRVNPYRPATKDGTYFLSGAVTRIVERLAERRSQREAESKAAPVRTSGTGRELVLSDVYGSEADLNNDALNNYPAGTTAQRRRKQDLRRAQQQAAHDQLVSEGVDSTVAWYRAYGYGDEQAQTLATSWAKTSRRRRGGRGKSQDWTQADERRAQKINSTAYRSGRAAGNSIGLDAQVQHTQRRLTKEV